MFCDSRYLIRVT